MCFQALKRLTRVFSATISMCLLTNSAGAGPGSVLFELFTDLLFFLDEMGIIELLDGTPKLVLPKSGPNGSRTAARTSRLSSSSSTSSRAVSTFRAGSLNKLFKNRTASRSPARIRPPRNGCKLRRNLATPAAAPESTAFPPDVSLRCLRDRRQSAPTGRTSGRRGVSLSRSKMRLSGTLKPSATARATSSCSTRS